eukprot:scaffold8246_cov74-Skeletonema_dohrnii-CCMP3373.AAC.1
MGYQHASSALAYHLEHAKSPYDSGDLPSGVSQDPLQPNDPTLGSNMPFEAAPSTPLDPMMDVLDEPTSLFAVEQVNKCFTYDPFDLPEPNWGPQPDDIMSFLISPRGPGEMQQSGVRGTG